MLGDSKASWKEVDGAIEIELNMRAFEVKTVKIVCI
jgi:hypothetical protein